MPGGTLTVAVAGLAMSKAGTGGLNYATMRLALSNLLGVQALSHRLDLARLSLYANRFGS